MEAIVPNDSIVPLVGRVTLHKSLSNVLLPAPFCPMMPSASPRSTSNVTSCNAGNTECLGRRVMNSMIRSAGRG